jgi:hypothetical protein
MSCACAILNGLGLTGYRARMGGTSIVARVVRAVSNVSEPLIGYLSLLIVEMNVMKLHMRKMLFCNEWSAPSPSYQRLTNLDQLRDTIVRQLHDGAVQALRPAHRPAHQSQSRTTAVALLRSQLTAPSLACSSTRRAARPPASSSSRTARGCSCWDPSASLRKRTPRCCGASSSTYSSCASRCCLGGRRRRARTGWGGCMCGR